jgi:glutamate 5-kinase
MFDKASSIIIKIGSNVLIKDGSLKTTWLDSLAQDVAYLKSLGKQVIIVSSGSLAIGRKFLNIKSDLTLKEKQAACSIGQIELMSRYKEIFANHNLRISQILLTGFDSSHRQSYINAKNTILTLLKNDIIPVVNENDTTAVQELKIGDNDRLAARVAQMVDADLLVLLSDVNGLYNKNPIISKDAKLIELVEDIDDQIEAMASGPVSKAGTGGMVTKIKAAKMAFNCGCSTIISNGLKERAIKNILDKSKYTLFKTNKDRITAKKQWILDDFNYKGELVVNKNAALAIKDGASLLPVGIVKLSGKFEEGDNIIIKDQASNHIASGLSNYSSDIARSIIGKNSLQIKDIFGNKVKFEMVHRDNMVIV